MGDRWRSIGKRSANIGKHEVNGMRSSSLIFVILLFDLATIFRATERMSFH